MDDLTHLIARHGVINEADAQAAATHIREACGTIWEDHAEMFGMLAARLTRIGCPPNFAVFITTDLVTVPMDAGRKAALFHLLSELLLEPIRPFT